MVKKCDPFGEEEMWQIDLNFCFSDLSYRWSSLIRSCLYAYFVHFFFSVALKNACLHVCLSILETNSKRIVFGLTCERSMLT